MEKKLGRYAKCNFNCYKVLPNTEFSKITTGSRQIVSCRTVALRKIFVDSPVCQQKFSRELQF